MSFYIYYGKLDNELLVTVLPNGTIESGDPIHLFTQKRFLKLAVKEVTTSSDGEDLVTFKDGYFSYKAVPKKGYKELDLTVKGTDGKSSQVTLTRHYDQPITAISPSDPPKIWTGAIDFHNWAKNESFIAIAPMGLGNEKPIVCLWQWTKDDKGVAKTLSFSTDKQVSAKGNPGVFSFKQGGYYTLNCKVNEKTNGLNVTVKGPTNAEVVQKELVLSAKVELGGEHRFAPPRPPQQKIELECSYPRAAPSLPRITGQLPFPAGLVETLSYSAAFVDQAGYLAQHAIKQFNDLEKSYRVLDNKAEARGAKVADLKAEVTKLGDANKTLTTENAKLKKDLADTREAAEKTQKSLQNELAEALAKLTTAETKNKRLVAENEKLRKYIAADKLADIEREKKHEEHDKADHAHIDSLSKALKKSQQVERDLQNKVAEKKLIIAALTARVETLGKQLGDAESHICKLKAELANEKTENEKIQKELNEKTAELKTTQTDLEATKKKLADESKAHTTTQGKLKQSKTDLADLQASYNRVDGIRKTTEATNNSLNTDLDAKTAKITELINRLQALEAEAETAAKDTSAVQPVTVPKTPVQATVTELVA